MPSRKEFLSYLFDKYPDRRKIRKPLANRQMDEHDAAQIAHEMAHGLPLPQKDRLDAFQLFPATVGEILKEHRQQPPHSYIHSGYSGMTSRRS